MFYRYARMVTSSLGPKEVRSFARKCNHSNTREGILSHGQTVSRELRSRRLTEHGCKCLQMWWNTVFISIETWEFELLLSLQNVYPTVFVGPFYKFVFYSSWFTKLNINQKFLCNPQFTLMALNHCILIYFGLVQNYL